MRILQARANSCNTLIIDSDEQLSHPSFAPMCLLQPYGNRAGTDAYAVDKQPLRLAQNTRKVAKFPDNLVQAGTHHFRFLISRFQVRVLDGSLLYSP